MRGSSTQKNMLVEYSDEEEEEEEEKEEKERGLAVEGRDIHVTRGGSSETRNRVIFLPRTQINERAPIHLAHQA